MKKFCISCVLFICSIFLCACGEDPPPFEVVFLKEFVVNYYEKLDGQAIKNVDKAYKKKARLVLLGLRNDRDNPDLELSFNTSGLVYTLLAGGSAQLESYATIQVEGPVLVSTAEFPEGREFPIKTVVKLAYVKSKWKIEFLQDFFQYSSSASSVDIGLVAGDKGCPEYQMGLDLRMVGKKSGFNVYVYASSGPEDNLNVVFDDDNLDMGITQQDTLLFVRSGLGDREEIVSEIGNLRSIYALNTVPVNVIATRGLEHLDHLAGKIMAIGRKITPTYVTGSQLMFIAGIATQATIPSGGLNAIKSLRQGKVDAMVLVDDCDMDVRDEFLDNDKFTLVPVTSSYLLNMYPHTVVPAGTFPWQTKDVPTIGVRNVLFTFDYGGERCKKLGYFADAIRDNIRWLRRHGDPAWEHVDLDAKLPGWTRYDCMDKNIRKIKK